MNKNKIFVILGAVVVLALVLAMIIVPKGNKQDTPKEENQVVSQTETSEKEESNENTDKTETAEKADEVLGKPKFMYFVSDADDTKSVIDRLTKEYKNKVDFEVLNVDKDKELLEKFSLVDGNTPALIMLDENQDIINILFKTNDYDKLKEAIELAFN